MISDCNFHLPTLHEPVDLQLIENKKLLDKAIDIEFNICKHGIEKTLDSAFKKADSLGLFLVNFMILDSDFAKQLCCIDFNIELKEGHYITVLIDPYDDDAAKHVESAFQNGISGVKFHPYLQKIHKETYSKIHELAILAQSKNMWVAIDCSYGTDLLYKVNGVDLCAYLLNSGYTGKLLSLHFGGPRIFDVMSLMAQHNNIYADLSLSLSYWKGSSVWDDLNFAISRVGYRRFIFGSDQPFIQFDKAVNDFEEFSTKYGITTEMSESIKHNNFYEFLSEI